MRRHWTRRFSCLHRMLAVNNEATQRRLVLRNPKIRFFFFFFFLFLLRHLFAVSDQPRSRLSLSTPSPLMLLSLLSSSAPRASISRTAASSAPNNASARPALTQQRCAGTDSANQRTVARPTRGNDVSRRRNDAYDSFWGPLGDPFEMFERALEVSASPAVHEISRQKPLTSASVNFCCF